MSTRLSHIASHVWEARNEVSRVLKHCRGLELSNPTKEEIAWLCKYWNLLKEIEHALDNIDRSIV